MADVRIKYVVDDGELVLARKELDKINKELGIGQKETKGLSSDFKALGGVVAAAFTIDKLVDFGRQVVSITAEFQKLKAVLINTLGSRSAADQAFKNIQKFAANTPFQVNQLTDSFVKLANQGFVPTTNELRKLGDLAASTGKEFDQLTEAIIDAQVGEFERLKEFGIRASKEGDNVTFTFKGVQTQVDFTAESIQGYILSLGDLQGVSGSMAAISETLGGKLSNMQDNIDSLFFAIGEKLNPVIGGSIDLFNNFIGAVTEYISTPFVDELKKQQIELNTLVGAITSANTSTEARSHLLTELNSKYPDFLKNLSQEEQTNENISKRMEDVNAQFLRKIALEAAQERLTENQEELLDAIEREANLRKAIAHQEERNEKIRAGTARRQRGDAGSLQKLENQLNETISEREEIQKGLSDQLKVYTDALDIFNGSSKDYFESTEKSAEATKEISKAWGEAGNNLLFWRKELEKLGGLSDFDLDEIGLSAIAGAQEEAGEKIREENEEVKQSFQDLADFEAMQLEIRRAKYEAFFGVLDVLGDEFFLRQQQRISDEQALLRQQSDEKIEALEAERDKALAVVGDESNAKKAILQRFQQDKEAIENEIAQKERELRIEAAKAQKAQAAFNIITSTAQAIIAALSPPPLGLGPIAGVPFSVSAGIIGGAQLAAVLTRPLPRFARGVIGLQGPGSETSDSIPAFLSRGESVMTGKETRDFRPTLKAIRENRVDAKLLNAISEGRGDINQVITEVPRDRFSWDERGFRAYLQRGSMRIEKKARRYKA